MVLIPCSLSLLPLSHHLHFKDVETESQKNLVIFLNLEVLRDLNLSRVAPEFVFLAIRQNSLSYSLMVSRRTPSRIHPLIEVIAFFQQNVTSLPDPADPIN